MSADEDRRALQRFVAGLPVDADALATAITAEALDHALVDDALLRALASDDATVRRRTARRIARMADVGEAVAGRLAILAQADADERTRALATAALRAHGRLPEAPRARPPRRFALTFTFAAVRSSGAVGYELSEPLEGLLIPDARLLLVDGVVHLQLQELPAEFAGTFPVVLDTDAAGEQVELARATLPVSPDGAVTIALAPEAGSLRALAERLRRFEVIVPEA